MDVGGTIGAILSKKGAEVYSIAPAATVFEAIEMMDAKNVGALLVLQGEEVVGIISERDYTRKVFLKGKRSRETKVEEIMSKDVTVTSSNEPVDNCMRLMTEKRIRHLPPSTSPTMPNRTLAARERSPFTGQANTSATVWSRSPMLSIRT